MKAMKQHYLFLSVMAFVFILCACQDPSTERKEMDPADAENNLRLVKNFAEGFVPDTTSLVMDRVHHFPDSVVAAFKSLRADRSNMEKYLTLLYLKIYRGHLQCCHQSYELRKNVSGGIDSLSDPLLYEYNFITRFYNSNKPIEMIGSGLADVWVEHNRRLLKDPQIKKEYDIIKTIQNNMEKGDYWKE